MDLHRLTLPSHNQGVVPAAIKSRAHSEIHFGFMPSGRDKLIADMLGNLTKIPFFAMCPTKLAATRNRWSAFKPVSVNSDSTA